MKNEFAVFGAGCFWGVQAAFDEQKGVLNTLVGYEGGKTKSPTYEDVCTDETGHAEVVQVEFNPKEISYRELVELFFRIHDPTTLNKQGPDYGSQYRSVIFYFSEGQKKIAQEVIKKAQSNFKNKIVTEIVPHSVFNKAEEYHQKYLEKTGRKVCH